MNLHAVILLSIMQAHWNIQDDDPKSAKKKKTLRKMNEAWKQFKSTLKTDFMEEGRNPVGYYKWLKQEDWEEFQALKSTAEFKVYKFSQLTFSLFFLDMYLSSLN